MPYENFPGQHRPPAEIAELERRIRALPPEERLPFKLEGTGLVPPGYIWKDDRLKYVQVDNSRPWYLNPAIVGPAIVGGPLAAAGLLGGGAAAGVGAYGTGAGLNAAGTFASQAASPLLAGGTLAGTSAAAAAAGLPTIASRVIGNGMGTDPTDITGATRQLPELVWDAAAGKFVEKAASGLGNKIGDLAKSALGNEMPSWLAPVIASLAGLPSLLAKQGPSDEEKAYQAQATRLLKQQEQRTQFQNPLYETITRMAYGLQPTMGTSGNPYPYNTLDDVRVP